MNELGEKNNCSRRFQIEFATVEFATVVVDE